MRFCVSRGGHTEQNSTELWMCSFSNDDKYLLYYAQVWGPFNIICARFKFNCLMNLSMKYVTSHTHTRPAKILRQERFLNFSQFSNCEKEQLNTIFGRIAIIAIEWNTSKLLYDNWWLKEENTLNKQLSFNIKWRI